MSKPTGSYLVPIFTLLVTLAASGCGSAENSARPDIAAVSDEEHFGRDVKEQLYVFRAKVRKRGASAAKQDLPDLLEGIATYDQRRIANKEVYKEIVEKLKALEGKLSAASKEELVKAADEIGALADKLPGKAEPNPMVE
jgi:hypothetical protein